MGSQDALAIGSLDNGHCAGSAEIACQRRSVNAFWETCLLVVNQASVQRRLVRKEFLSCWTFFPIPSGPPLLTP
jgi:hypothetical protein